MMEILLIMVSEEKYKGIGKPLRERIDWTI